MSYTFFKLSCTNINLKYSNDQGGKNMYQNEQLDLITIDEFCELLSIGRNSAYTPLNSAEIKAFKIRRIWKIPGEAVDEYIRRKSNL